MTTSPLFLFEIYSESHKMGGMIMLETELISVSEAAKIIGCSESHVRYMIARGLMKSKKIGKVHVIPTSEAGRIRDCPHKVGRPRKKMSVA